MPLFLFFFEKSVKKFCFCLKVLYICVTTKANNFIISSFNFFYYA